MKRLVLAAVAVAAVLTMAVPAGADGYPPSDHGAPTAVSAPPPAPSERAPTGALPRTGDDSSLTLARGAAVLIAAGGVLVLVARRRQAVSANRPVPGAGSARL